MTMTKEEAIENLKQLKDGGVFVNLNEALDMAIEALSADATKKKAELKENGEWDCPDVDCDECDHHRSVSWCSLAIPNHDRDWIIGCIEHDGFIKTDRFDKANQIILDALSAEAKWIPCSERLPEEHEWVGTKKFGTTISDEVYVTFESPKGERFCKHLSFQNGELSRHDQLVIDTVFKGSKPIAWMPLPKPYREDGDSDEAD